jgi:hypothetical protein
MFYLLARWRGNKGSRYWQQMEGHPIAKLGIGIEETNASISIPASMISVRYRNKEMLYCFGLVWYRTGSGTVIFFSFRYQTDWMPAF